MGVGSATEGEDGALLFRGAAQGGAKLIGFDFAESRLAQAFEDLWDFQASGLLDAFIKIDKPPGELAREQRADGGFA